MCRGDTPGLYIAAGVCASAQVEILDCLLKFKLNMNCNIAQLLLCCIQRSQLRWFGYVIRSALQTTLD